MILRSYKGSVFCSLLVFWTLKIKVCWFSPNLNKIYNDEVNKLKVVIIEYVDSKRSFQVDKASVNNILTDMCEMLVSTSKRKCS